MKCAWPRITFASCGISIRMVRISMCYPFYPSFGKKFPDLETDKNCSPASACGTPIISGVSPLRKRSSDWNSACTENLVRKYRIKLLGAQQPSSKSRESAGQDTLNVDQDHATGQAVDEDHFRLHSIGSWRCHGGYPRPRMADHASGPRRSRR